MLSMHLFLPLGIHRGGQSSRYFTRTDNGSSKSAVCSRRTSSRRSNVDNAFIGIYTIHGFTNQLLELIILGDCFFSLSTRASILGNPSKHSKYFDTECLKIELSKSVISVVERSVVILRNSYCFEN